MIKLNDVSRFEAIKKAQNNVGIHTNYLIDVLAPAIARGDWAELEMMDIGFKTNGESLGKIGDDEAWKKLQPFFEPNASSPRTLDFTLNGEVIERNLRNQFKALILKMLWLSPKDYSFEMCTQVLNDLKKLIRPLLDRGVNSLSYITFELLEEWIETGSTGLEFRRARLYTALNKLVVEKNGLPFHVGLTTTVLASDFNLRLIEQEQHTVIPQRLYYRALCEAKSMVERVYSIRDEVEVLSKYLITYKTKLYKAYARHLYAGNKAWYLNVSKAHKKNSRAFQREINGLESPTLAQISKLIEQYQPVIATSNYKYILPNHVIAIDGKTISNPKQATSLLSKYSGGCLWTVLAKSGMRVDELYQLHTVNGCQKEVISGQVIYILNADLSKTVEGNQAQQDTFVTTELGKKAYEILQSIHRPLRKLHTNNSRFFHTLKNKYNALTKKGLSEQAQGWFNDTLHEELGITKEDLKDLQISNPKQSFKLGDNYQFSCHQLRRSFAYYLIGYELLSFPQLKNSSLMSL